MTSRSEQGSVAWNEEMVRRYDIDRYYSESHAIVRWIERQRVKLLVAAAAPSPGDRILEVGCGAGHVLAHFAGDVTGVDLSSTMLLKARRRLGPRSRLVRGSALDLPLPACAFDVVICTEVLEHVPDPSSAIAELMRVAAPGARVVVSIPNERNIDRAKRIIARTPVLRSLMRTLAGEGNEWHLHEFDLALLRQVSAGVARIDSVRGVPFRAFPVRYVATLRSAQGGDR